METIFVVELSSDGKEVFSEGHWTRDRPFTVIERYDPQMGTYYVPHHISYRNVHFYESELIFLNEYEG